MTGRKNINKINEKKMNREKKKKRDSEYEKVRIGRTHEELNEQSDKRRKRYKKNRGKKTKEIN